MFDPFGLYRERPEIFPGYIAVGFFSRSLAAILDTLLIALILAPFFTFFNDMIYGSQIQSLMSEFSAASQDGISNREAAAFQRGMVEAGFMSKMLYITIYQTLVLGAITIIFWRYKSATPGKILLGMKIVDAKTGEPCSTKQDITRFLGYFVSMIVFMLGFIWIAFNEQKRGWHDMIAGTIVVMKKK